MGKIWLVLGEGFGGDTLPKLKIEHQQLPWQHHKQQITRHAKHSLQSASNCVSCYSSDWIRCSVYDAHVLPCIGKCVLPHHAQAARECMAAVMCCTERRMSVNTTHVYARTIAHALQACSAQKSHSRRAMRSLAMWLVQHAIHVQCLLRCQRHPCRSCCY